MDQLPVNKYHFLIRTMILLSIGKRSDYTHHVTQERQLFQMSQLQIKIYNKLVQTDVAEVTET